MKNLLTIACVALSLVGCNTALKPTPENYLTTLNKYLPDHQDCLLDGSVTFPYETSDPAMTKKMDALVHSKVLDVAREPAIHVSRYTLTREGSTAGHNLCYGYREATAIVSSTPPAPMNGYQGTIVVYSYKVRDIPVWAKTAEIMAAFPTFAHEQSGDATDTITLALTGVGWTVPN